MAGVGTHESDIERLNEVNREKQSSVSVMLCVGLICETLLWGFMN